VGARVSPFYDSLLAKVIAHGRDRAATIGTLVDALDATRIDGVATNVDLLAAVFDEPAFRAGDLHTGFLEEHAVVERLSAVPDEVIVAAAASRSMLGPAGGAHLPGDPWRVAGPWRSARVAEPMRWLVGGRTATTRTTIDPGGGGAVVDLDGRASRADPSGGDGVSGWSLAIGADTALVRPATGARRVETVTWLGRRHRISPAPAPDASPPAAIAVGPDALAAPMPGRIVRIHVAEGDRVRPNAPLVILEAMKMEHVIAASGAGRVARLHVAVGDQVVRGAPLVDLDDEVPA